MGTSKSTGRTRANGEGSFRIRGKSVEFRFGNPIRSVSEKVDGRTKAELRARLKALSVRPQQIDARVTVSKYADAWYADMERRVEDKKLEESTYVSYSATLKMIKTAWGDMRLDALTATDIDSGIDAMRKPDGDIYSISAKRHVKTMLGQIYRKAIKEKLIDRALNPMLDVDELVSPTDQAVSEKDAYSADDLPGILSGLPNNKYGHAARVCIATGIRGQELLPLRVEDFEPDGSAFVVNKAMKRGKSKYTGGTKNASSTRFIEVPEFAQPSVLWLIQHAKRGYIMPNRAGGYVAYCTYLEGYNTAIKKVDVKRLPPHCMRHTFTTNYKIRLGFDDALVMAATGHADRRTMEGYTHAHANDLRALADRYNDFVQSLPKKDKQ